jgi:nitroreductase
METWDVIRARRNVRTFAAKPVPAADLERVLEAGRRAPSAMNRQHWDFVVCTSPTLLNELAEVWQWGKHVAGSAATVVLVLPEAAEERDRRLDEFDLGQAVMAMMLAAADLGIGSGHASVGDQALARRLLGIPEGYTCAYMLALGYPADRPLKPLDKPNRRPLEEVVHRERW